MMCQMGITLEVIAEKLDKIERQLSATNPVREPYYSRDDLRRIFGISYPTVDAWTEQGIFKSFRVGSRIYYDPAQVREIVEGRAK